MALVSIIFPPFYWCRLNPMFIITPSIPSQSARSQTQTHHLIDRLDNPQHLFIRDPPIAIDIVQLKRPIQLILHLASTRDAERADELLEVDAAGLVAVEDVEHVFCEGSRVAKGEKLSVDFLKFGFGEVARGTVFEEAWARANRVCQSETREQGGGVLCCGRDGKWVHRLPGKRGRGEQNNPPLYHCCNSFLSKCVAFCRSDIS